ncbi:hypothetical protein DFJ73DRAFT_827963, partial [Zopfochytrium polystomum]
MPVGLIVGGLRLVNPVPFVERLLRLFVWHPRGVHSLLQKLSGILCGLDQTLADIKSMKQQLRGSDRDKIEKAIEPWIRNVELGTPGEAPGSRVTDAEIQEQLLTAGVNVGDPATLKRNARMSHNPSGQGLGAGAAHPSDPCVRYARLLLRRAEKERFVDIIGGPEVTAFIVHLASIFPPMLTELWACIDMADLAKTFF